MTDREFLCPGSAIVRREPILILYPLPTDRQHVKNIHSPHVGKAQRVPCKHTVDTKGFSTFESGGKLSKYREKKGGRTELLFSLCP